MHCLAHDCWFIKHCFFEILLFEKTVWESCSRWLCSNGQWGGWLSMSFYGTKNALPMENSYMRHLQKTIRKKERSPVPSIHIPNDILYNTNSVRSPCWNKRRKYDNEHVLRIYYWINTTHVISRYCCKKPLWGICGFIKILDNSMSIANLKVFVPVV